MKATYKASLTIMAAVMLVALTAAGAPAAIGGSDSKHNMTELAGYGFDGSVCSACHRPHFSNGDRLWTPDRDVAGDGLRDLAAAKAASADQSAGTGDYPGIYLCLDCHGSASAPSWASGAAAANTHSTREMQAAGYTTKYGSFVVQCTDCHDPHIHWNGTFTGGQNGYMIKDSIITPNSGTKTVVFTALTGPGSMGTNTSSYDAICEVCHTATSFHTNSGAPEHNDGKNCTSCHLHAGGFSAACSACHGNPPVSVDTLVGGASNPGSPATGAATPGKHAFHTMSTAGGAGYGCQVCHRAGMGDGEGADMEIDVRFGFAGYTSGSFDGFSTVNGYSFSPGNTAGGSLGCSDTYCHGNFPGGITTNVPVWDDSATGACGTCHAVAPPLLADHSVHLTASWGPRAACDDCHAAGSNTGGHADHVDGQVRFKDGQDLAGTTVCNTCHGTTAAAKPTWGDTSVRGTTAWCEGCHDGSSTVNTAAGTSGVSVTAPNVLGDDVTYGFEVTGHGKSGIDVGCGVCHLATSEHIDGVSQTYSAASDNYKQGYRLDAYNVTPILGNYSSTKIALCYTCHVESRVVGMPTGGRPSALHNHSVKPSDVWYTNFRNMSTTAGLFKGNWDAISESGYSYDIPTNIHWNHLDDFSNSRRMTWLFGSDYYIYDSDGDGTGDSRITCDTCHNPHGSKSPAMVLEDFSLQTYSNPPNPSYRWIGNEQYLTTRCSNIACHTYGDVEGTGGTRYYREQGSLSTVGDCGTCHAIAPPLLADHSVHLASSWGPRAACDDCHAAGSNTGSQSDHMDGLVQFEDGQQLAGTDACNTCHGTTAAAKPTWGDTSVRGQTAWCESCHDGSSTVNTFAGTSGVNVTAPNVLGDGITYGFEATGHGMAGINVDCDACHLATSEHVDGDSQTYSAASDNYKQGYRLDAYNVTPILGNYSSTKIALCYSCHIENRVVGMPAEGRPSAWHNHSVKPSDDWYTDFRNMSTTAGLFAGNWDAVSKSGYTHDIPTNIHWNHLDDFGNTKRMLATFGTDYYIYDSDGDGTGDSRITCDTCHNPHGSNSPAMVLEDFSLQTYSNLPNPSYRWLGSGQYVTTRCSNTACHTYGDVEGTGGTRYYREPGSLSTVFGVPWGLAAEPLP